MTIKLSQHAGGGEIYSPAMMEFDGSTGYLIAPADTISGNAQTFMCSFKVASFSGTGGYWLCSMNVSNKFRLLCYLTNNDNTKTNWREKLGVYIVDNTNTPLVRLTSNVVVTDNKIHTVWVTYNGTTGDYALKIDGQDAVDTGDADHSVISGTLPTGTITTNAAYVGTNNTFTIFLEGSIGFLGYDSSILEYSDYFNENGTPREVDGTGLEYFNPHGELTNNIGTGNNYTKTGSVVISDAGTVIPNKLGLDTIGDATASDIADGKIAWVDGERIVGEKFATSSTLLLWDIGKGASGVYTPNIIDADYAAPGVTLTGTVNNITRDGNGWATGNNARVLIALPAKTTRCRQFIYRVLAKSVTPAANARFEPITNYNTTTGYFTYHRLMYNSVWGCHIYEYDGSPETLRDTEVNPSVGLPSALTIIIEDWGPLIRFEVLGYETDTTASTDSTSSVQWYNASRFGKDSPNAGFRWVSSEDFLYLSSMQIIDVPD